MLEPLVMMACVVTHLTITCYYYQKLQQTIGHSPLTSIQALVHSGGTFLVPCSAACTSLDATPHTLGIACAACPFCVGCIRAPTQTRRCNEKNCVLKNVI